MLTPNQNKALDFSKHISLTANAGSGKTFVLSKRYVEIAVSQNISLRNIVAITFTDKAAGELYQKIAAQIESRILNAENNKTKFQLESLRNQLVSSNISTIHSFCSDILREFPVEAGIDANFTAIDETFSDELIELSINEAIKLSLENSEESENLKYLVRIFASKSILSRELAKSLKQRRNVLSLINLNYSKSVENIAQNFYETFLSLSEKILEGRIKYFLKAVKKINSAVLQSSPQNTTASEVNLLLEKINHAHGIIELLAVLREIKEKILVSKGTVAVKGYLSRTNYQDIMGECILVEDFLGQLTYFNVTSNHEQTEIELAKFGKEFLKMFSKALNIYTEKKREIGCLDYEDILLHTQSLIENKKVRQAIADRFKYIMIDEYQDTNELQYQIFMPILNYLANGNLFIVGDDKQSIYMFRDAELEIFNRTKNKIYESVGNEGLLSLPDSFRMAPKICLFINKLFKNLFQNPNPLYNEVEHSEVVCARNDGVLGYVEFLIAESGADDEKYSEAELVANRIIKLKEEPNLKKEINWGDIVILCRKRKSFKQLEKVFLKKNIPFTIVGGQGFYQRQVIYDIYNYFSFLINQNDDTALVGVLRSPFFSLSDSQLFEISLESERTFWAKLKIYAAADPIIVPIVNLLIENIEALVKIDVPNLLRKILTETSYLAVLNNRFSAIQEQANLEKLLNLTIKFFSEGFKTLYDYVNFLKGAINEIEDESQADISDELNSVKIMTIHQAKGLEFPIVFLFNCGDTSQKNLVKAKSVNIDKTFGLLTKVPAAGDYFADYQSAPIIGLANYMNEMKNIAELKRLLYVAATRAKDYLFISADIKNTASLKRDSFIGLLADGLKLDFHSSKVNLKAALKFLFTQGTEYLNDEKLVELDIPIINNIETNAVEAAEGRFVKNKNAKLIKSITHKPSGEIYSASKLILFRQCPLKYNLHYNLRFSSLMNDYRNWANINSAHSSSESFDINDKEESVSEIGEENFLSAASLFQIKGKIIHRILAEELTPQDSVSKIEDYLYKTYPANKLSSETITKVGEEIRYELIKYFQSNNYKFIQSFQNSVNESEFYIKHKDYYLFGIIDKLIIKKNQLIIVDYKTDSFNLSGINLRAEQHFGQLKFYALIASKFYKNIEEIELRLVFLKYPDEEVKIILNTNDLSVITHEIENNVALIRANKFTKNLNHCEYCNFAVNKNCVVI